MTGVLALAWLHYLAMILAAAATLLRGTWSV